MQSEIKKSINLLALLLSYFCLPAYATPQYIFFDLPETLVTTSEMSFFKDVIGVSGVTYALFGNNPWKLEQITFKALDTLGTQKSPELLSAQTPKGRILPQIFCDFLTGTISSHDARKQAKDQIKRLYKEDFFSSKRERNLVLDIIDAIFNPESLAKHTVPLSGAVEFLEACVKQFGSQHLYIIANWDFQSFKRLMQAPHAEELFRHFSHKNIFISGTTKRLLPHPSCFEPPISLHKLPREQCVFISALESHVHAAQQAGIFAILIQPGDLSTAQQRLGL